MNLEEREKFEKNVRSINSCFKNIITGGVAEEFWINEFRAIETLIDSCKKIALQEDNKSV